MASIIEKYEQIFAADPRSRIFVELARALLERGDAARAIEVCRTGLEHHPSSILGRVIWGRGLLSQNDLAGAQQQFDRAVELDPTSPYAFNLVGEALFGKQLYREALPILARAVELQPGDDRLRGWLEQARQQAGTNGVAAASQPGFAQSTKTPVFGQGPAPVRPRAAAPSTSAPTPVPTSPMPAPGPTDTVLLHRAPATVLLHRAPATARVPASGAPVPLPAPAAPVPLPAPEPAANASQAGPTGTVFIKKAPPPLAPAAPPPLSPALHRDEIPRSLLHMIPGATQPAVPAQPVAPAPPPPDEEEAEQITARYAQEVRARLQAEGEAPPSFARRHFRLFVGLLLAAAAAGGVLLFLHLRETGRGEAFARAAAAARAGLARDTVGALRQAEQVLVETRKGGSTPELTSLTAQVEALLAVDHGDEKARALAGELAQQAEAGDGGVAAAYLLAKGPTELGAAESAVLAAPEDSAPLVQELAGRILQKRGDPARARERYLRAASATPPSLRALADLGDLELAIGKPDAALAFYGAAPGTDETRAAAQRVHARSVIGAAEARLALGQDLARARADLEALEADPAAAPPKALRIRQEVATARVLYATGDPAAAATRLSRATAALGESVPLATAAAELHLAARAYDRAEASAARAVALQPGDSAARVLLARARIGRGKYAEAIAATGNAEGRAIWLQRGIARYRLGQYAEAERELAKTASSGNMPPDAAVWYALTRMKLGHAEEALGLLQRLAARTPPPPLTYVAMGEVHAKLGNAEEAESAWRSAIEREPTAPEAHAALGLALQARGANDEAIPELQKTLAADPLDFRIRYALGAARLATGHPALARAELDAVLLARPADLDALCLLSTAWLAEGQPKEARRAADRGLARAPTNPALLLAAGRAALAQGDPATAKSLAERAVKAAGRGPLAAEAREFRATFKKK